MDNNDAFLAQTTRIKNKLEQAKEVDKNLSVFGAKSHKYQLGPTLSLQEIQALEREYGVTLPADYVAFLINVGNGDPKKQWGSAGPYYGIFSLLDMIKETESLKSPTLIKPNMSDEYWETLKQSLEGGFAPTETMNDRIFGGLLTLGTQGCTYYHALVLNGEFAGRIVNIDDDLCKPQFAYESNFLDWYERWLDEIISGILTGSEPTSFGFTMGGDDIELLDIYSQSKDPREKTEALKGLLKLVTIRPESCQKLQEICEADQSEHMAVQALTKFNHMMAIPYLERLIDQDDDSCQFACQSIRWFANDHADMWVEQLKKRLRRGPKHETYQTMVFLLLDTGANFGDDLIPFCKDKDEDIRATTFWALGEQRNKPDYIDAFLEGLGDPSPRIVHSALQAVAGITDKRLMKRYYEITERFKTDDYYILTNLDRQLKELGFRSRRKFILSHHLNPNYIPIHSWWRTLLGRFSR